MLSQPCKQILCDCCVDFSVLNILRLFPRNNEHVEIVKQLVQSRIEKEELEAELIRYKVM
jgi:hypothetical protein